MPPKRTRKLEVFTEGEPTRRASPRNKRPLTEDARDALPPAKRAALGDKTKAANSRESSFRDGEGPQKGKRTVVKKGGKKGDENSEATRATRAEKKEVKKEETAEEESVAESQAEQAKEKEEYPKEELVDENGIEQPEETEVTTLDKKPKSTPIDQLRQVQEALKLAGISASHLDLTNPQAFAKLISSRDAWTPALLTFICRQPGLTTLDLSMPAPSPGSFSVPSCSPDLLLKPFFSFSISTSLTTLSFRNRYLTTSSISLLRMIPALVSLDLTATSITNHALYHLTVHTSLSLLNLNNNPSITDDVRPVFSALPSLRSLYLRGTSFTTPALRRLVTEDLPKGCRLLSIPAPTIEALNSRGERYCMEIPQGEGYLEDPAVVGNQGVEVLRRNLELHKRCNKDIQTSGTKVELAGRLRGVLEKRRGDEGILAVLGRET
ncbi:hypothetical protein FPQ18DRAFT_403143 [Pyronema domesticum]|uniref:Uncharacterized protein n=1 Tax=Pyronema omphalodes (strain CBS 100304) TaxID=1076935 RepID=U4LBF0_PYROM|nr:hypothetical protein FPQ18DRAFT_403143 [Pyronema domesticum]CCX16522.1 Similar to hypothetical protein [Tuber melanosporum Mel28]; acc. no. XP_002838438 [Pyronema omphalodes CBS 100304]